MQGQIFVIVGEKDGEYNIITHAGIFSSACDAIDYVKSYGWTVKPHVARIDICFDENIFIID